MNDHVIRVLVVDDDEDDYILTRALLSDIQDKRFETEWVATYEAAMEAIGHNRHDVVLLDYYLGAQNGLELLCEALRKGCTAPLILLTGQADHAVDLEAMKAGAADYLTKERLDAPLLERSIRYALERRRTLEALREERNRLRTLIESSRSGIIMVGTELRLRVINALALEFLGLPGQPEDWIDRPLQDVLATLRHRTPAVVRTILAEIRRLQRGEQRPGEGECELYARTLHWLDVPVLAGTTPLGWLLMLRDVTEERLLEKMRRDLTHMTVHDLRNPLNAISGSLAILDMQLSHDLLPKQRRMLEIAGESSATMLKLVNRILDVSRLESGQMPLERAPVSLAELITETLQTQSLLAAGKNLRLESEVPLLLPPIWADVNLIERVLQNLVSNAIKFTVAGGLVRVTVAELVKQENDQFSYLRVSVSDSGPGIPLEFQSQIFQKFVTGQQRESGSGLGLAFCKLAIEAHGGRIWLESEPGQGTSFIFTLPMARNNHGLHNGRHPKATVT